MSEMNMEFNEEFRNLYNLVERTSANVFLTGKAGTGKTTFLKYLRAHSSKRMVVAAPTGVAAINAGGVTLHSLFQLPFEPFLPGMVHNERYHFSREKQNIIRSLDLLVIDEISMVRADVLDAVDDTLRFVRRNQNPFGGLQLLLIGDMQQLPPVLTSAEENFYREHYPSSYFFHSHALSRSGYCYVELTKIYRQTETKFVDLLNAVRNNCLTGEQLDELNSHYKPGFDPDEAEGYIRLTTHNNKARVVNEQKLADLPGETFSFTAEVTGSFLESSYPTDKVLVLKKGAQVMFIKNDPNPEKAYFNGKIGIVSAITNEGVMVTFPDGTRAEAPRLKWDNVQYELNDTTKEIEEKVIGSFLQIPLRLAWAITIHKSQGLTFDKVMLDANAAFAHGQVYVALSRCRTLDGLVLSSPLSASAILNDDVILSFSQQVKTCAVSGQQISEMEKAYGEHLLVEQFDFSAINGTLLAFIRIFAETLSHVYDNLSHYVKTQQAVFQTEVVEVGIKFQNQALSLSRTKDPALQERITKASNYFSEKIETILGDLPSKLAVEINRKEVQKRYAALREDLKHQLDVKRGTLKKSATIFTIESYLHEKAMALIDEAEVKRRAIKKDREKKKKEPREKKIPTQQVSFDFYAQGMKPEQIAKERGLSVNTILGHLTAFVADGTIPVTDFVPQDHVTAIEEYVDSHSGLKGMKEIYDGLNEKYTYEEIKMVLSMPKYHQW